MSETFVAKTSHLRIALIEYFARLIFAKTVKVAASTIL